ncbi:MULTISPECIES: hypothetical protein [unclassified Sphingomonas]|uniref:hypothetical protein n=1 Tax=unclassified Sphingomonas TaxID=196159 RepID=UPI00092649E4|nr:MULTISPECIES: hypothetical protein [unclassified Sphingomonas]MBN8849575.1 hypothetical protein [Sphingomonas sp.]OJV31063.1 MAG: hypothetical protein BGO24_17705 [Sphingomonas sp. 67-36]
MNDPVPSETAARRPRVGLVTIFIVLAFAVGIALMFFAMRKSGGWFIHEQAATQPAAETAAPSPPSPTPTPTPAAPPPDLDALATRETALAAQIAALEARAAEIGTTSAAAATQAGRAEALMVAFATRRAIDRGVPLGYLEVQLRERFGRIAPGPVATVIQAARQPVTLAALRQALDNSANELINGDDGWLEGLRRQLGKLVFLHDANTPSQLPGERLARARRLLESGQVQAAIGEVSRLPGAADSGNWATAARRYVDAHRALDSIEAAALMLPPPAAPKRDEAQAATPQAPDEPLAPPATDAI